MSHAIDVSNGRANMAYVGDKPWWQGEGGLYGTERKPDQDFDSWITDAGLAWKVERATVRYASEKGGDAVHRFEDQLVLFRSDTKAPLGIVSPMFKRDQPRDVIEFFRDLTDFPLTTAGSLFGGRVVWAQADVGINASVLDPRDKMKGRLLFATPLNGTGKRRIRFVSERVVCANTLAVALGESGGNEISIGHKSVPDYDWVKQQLGIAANSFDRFMGQMRALAQVRITPKVAEKLTLDLMAPDLPDDDTEAYAKALDSYAVKTITGLFYGGARGHSLQGVAGTAYGFLNAVTEFVDHSARARSDDNRVFNAWLGKGDALKSKALDMLVNL